MTLRNLTDLSCDQLQIQFKPISSKMKKHYQEHSGAKGMYNMDGFHHANYNYDDESKTGQIKRVKSIEHLPKTEKREVSREKPKTKKPFIEPGADCESFEEVISCTKLAESSLTTYLTARALTGPALAYASQQETRKKTAKKPSKPLPEIPTGISDSLQPHLIGYSTVTHEGMYRQTNDDKIAIYLEDNAKWFSLYDGHGGSHCSQFLKESLHEEFFALNWKKDIPTALRQAFQSAESKWLKKGDKSGSCALVIFIYQNVCYVANLGDSRAVLSSEHSSKCYQITKDHKPSNPEEQKRIVENGGQIYQTTAFTESSDGICDMIVGPLRVFPGRLSITRTFGDFQAKDKKEGNPNVVICEPEVTSFEIDDHDMIIMGSDGVWDKVDNTETVEMMKNLQEKDGFKGEELLARGAELILEESMKRGSTDNISVLVIGLNDPDIPREPKKGNEHIKIMSALNGNTLRKKTANNKENSNPERIKQIDSRIQEINRTASRVLQQSRR